jgi:hypothetical protein
MKDVNKTTKLNVRKGEHATLTASFVGSYRWNKSDEKTRTILVTPPIGKTTYEVTDPSNCVKDVFEVTVSR